AHRGALVVLEESGKAKNFQCVYHAWGYNRRGDLTGVAFERGVKGLGGMPKTFSNDRHGPRQLRLASCCRLVCGSCSEDVPGIAEYLRDETCERMPRVLHKAVEIIGRYTQALPHTWTLYVGNVEGSHHASLLHLFF